MRPIRRFLSRHSLWIGFLAAFLPLLVLISLQSQWLKDLRETSGAAQQAVVSNYLEAVRSMTESFYVQTAERALNLPSSLFVEGKVEKAAHFFKKKETIGARELFVYNLVRGSKHEILVYDPEKHRMADGGTREMRHAIWVACSPFSAMAKKRTPLDSVTLSVDERDPTNRMILLPITDEESAVVAVAGMIVNEEFFEKKLLPSLIEKSIKKFFSPEHAKNVLVSVWNDRGELVTDSGGEAGQQDKIIRPFSFIFSDWKIGIQSRHRTAQQWASSNYTLNITLSILTAVVLLGGVLLALRTASREMKLSQMKADFVSNVSHELRTPLASIRVFGEFLRLGRARTPGKVQEYGEYIELESRRLTQLINNILDFSRIESGRKTYTFENVDLREIMDDILQCFEVRLRRSGVRIIYDEPTPLVPIARVDRDAVAQALANLMDNAVKYSGDSKEIAVGIGVKDGQAEVWVQDFGIGISREERDRIFDRFHRVGSSLIHDVKGFGLGLSIVSHIVKNHDGAITVSSEVGKGSTFTIHLPLVETRMNGVEAGEETAREPQVGV